MNVGILKKELRGKINAQSALAQAAIDEGRDLYKTERAQVDKLEDEILKIEEELIQISTGSSKLFQEINADYVNMFVKNSVEKMLGFVVRDLEMLGTYSIKYFSNDDLKGFVRASEPNTIWINAYLENDMSMTAAHEMRHLYQLKQLGRANLEADAIDYAAAAVRVFYGCPLGSTGPAYREIKTN